MATSADSVQVNLPKSGKKKNGTKAPATLNQFEISPAAAAAHDEAADSAPGCGWSNTGMWLLFITGFVFPPCFWVGVAAGLKSGQDGEFLVKRRKKLNTQQAYAWWGCVIMSFISAFILILVLAIYFGRKAPDVEGTSNPAPVPCCTAWCSKAPVCVIPHSDKRPHTHCQPDAPTAQLPARKPHVPRFKPWAGTCPGRWQSAVSTSPWHQAQGCQVGALPSPSSSPRLLARCSHCCDALSHCGALLPQAPST